MALTQEQQIFIEKIGAFASADMKKTKILASLTVAQAILESGWGKSGLTAKANNLFGIKAGTSWKGKVYNVATNEYLNGKYVTVIASFRAYASWAESIADHSALLTGAARYKNLVGDTDYKRVCKNVQADGYATAPNYATSLIALIEAYGLTKFDVVLPVSPVAPATPVQAATVKAGDKVKIAAAAKTYAGTTVAIPAKHKGVVYTAQQVKPDKVLVQELYSWVWLADLVKV